MDGGPRLVGWDSGCGGNGTGIEEVPGVTPEPIKDPKLTWKGWRRDVLRTLATLVGLVLVVGALWLTLALLMYPCHIDGRKQDTAALDLVSIQRALKLFHDRHQCFPSTEEGLRALVNDLRLERVPLDPWGNPYGYELRDGRPVLWSYGADGALGGEGDDADIFSRDDTHAR
jgi:general secretion pathway protein G